MRAAWLLALLFCAGPSLAEVLRFETAIQQLEHASDLRGQFRAAKGEARKAARRAAIEAYEAVHNYHPEARREASEAYFRAGELQRAAGKLNEALCLFEASVEVSASSPFRARALLESGHVQRRLRAFGDALSTYEKVIHSKKTAPKYRDRATFWKARVFLEMQKEEDARRVLQGLASATEDPLMCIRAYDELVLSAIREGDLEWAAGILEQCRMAVAGPLREETNLGSRVRNTFRDMRCRTRLKEAITARRQSRRQ